MRTKKRNVYIFKEKMGDVWMRSGTELLVTLSAARPFGVKHSAGRVRVSLSVVRVFKYALG